MKNKIVYSRFYYEDLHSMIENPSDKIKKFMELISFKEPIINNENFFLFYHKDIGTVEDMEKIFNLIENGI